MRVRVIIPNTRRVEVVVPEDPRVAERLAAIAFCPERVAEPKPVSSAPALDASELLSPDFPGGSA